MTHSDHAPECDQRSSRRAESPLPLALLLKYNCTSSSSLHTRRREERRGEKDRAGQREAEQSKGEHCTAQHCTAQHSNGSQSLYLKRSYVMLRDLAIKWNKYVNITNPTQQHITPHHTTQPVGRRKRTERFPLWWLSFPELVRLIWF